MGLGELEREVLAKVYVAGLVGQPASLAYLSKQLGLPGDLLRQVLDGLARRGLIKPSGGPGGCSYVLTEEGRSSIKVVMTGGAFDILHVGHLATLEAAKRLGDVLVVVVARDETVKRMKGREPLNSEQDRLKLVSALRPVDLALLGDLGDSMKTVEHVKPDVIALGYDQKHNERQIEAELRARGLKARVIRLDVHVPGVKSSKILARLLREL
ncbi:MAG TPA: FAD synthase [Candidatus Bathyarchaeota archaeon]|nr:FAD synthase [Candidatus Bathyarchaeota archaeon]